MLIHRAIEFATLKHQGQYRKGTKTPYIVHPMEVMQILTANGCGEEVVVAGILHDTLEDTKTTKEELTYYFGERVAELVACETEDKTKSWQERKQSTIDRLKSAEYAVKLIRCADQLANIRSLFDNVKLEGEKTWTHFNAGKKETEWYYRGVTGALGELADLDMYQELCYYIRVVFAD